MHAAQLGGILHVSSRHLTRVPLLPLTRLPISPARNLHTSIPTLLRNTGQSVSRPKSLLRAFLKNFSGSPRMELNGHVRHKRKGSPFNNSTHERPTKLFKPERSDTHNSDQSIDSQYMYGSDSIADAMVEPVTAATGENAEWQATIEQVVKNVVSIHFCQTCSFDTSPALSSEATGFVVDAAKGYILTNRHVVGSGPFWGYCIFDNHEEVGSRFLVNALSVSDPLTCFIVRCVSCLP